ncbi:MAG: hypothetical protein PHF44_04350 [Candidatus Pacebacteria bacterium]|nr:hypothetical protein [Candidatus Paceibacterota bacterium]
MEKDDLDKKANEILRKNVSPKIKQKMELLELNQNFLKDISVLRRKHSKLVKEYNFNFKKIAPKFLKITINALLWNKIKTEDSETSDSSAPLFTPKDKNRFKSLSKKAYKPLEDKNLNKDIIDLCGKYKIYPANLWKHTLGVFIATKCFAPPTHWFRVGLGNYETKEERKDIFKLPPNLNFAVKIEDNKETNEPELFIQIFENTSLRDLEKNWQTVFEQQKKLKEIKDTKKRFYPLFNLEKAKKIQELRKKGKSDWEIQEEIFGENSNLNFGKIENKRKNIVKQIRHQYKKK